MFYRKKINALKKTILVLIIILFPIAFIQESSAQIMLYYPYYSPTFFNPFYYGYFPAEPPLINPLVYLSPVRYAHPLLTATPGGGTTTLLTSLFAPTVAPAVTPTLGITTALLLGGGVSTTTLALLAALTTPATLAVPTLPTLLPTVPAAPAVPITPTIGFTTALLLGGGGVSTTTLLLLGI